MHPSVSSSRNSPVRKVKVGRLYGRRFATRREAMDEVMDWLAFYNHKSLHPTLGYVSPMMFEPLKWPR